MNKKLHTITWYEQQLNNTNLSPLLIEEYERAIEILSDREYEVDKQIKDLKNKHKQELEELKKTIASGITSSAIDSHGIPEFGDDYELCQEGNEFVVYSKVANNAIQNHKDRHVFDSLTKAISKYRTLIYYRLYDKYVRTSDVTKLSEL